MNKTKHVLLENEFKNLKTFHSSLFICQSYFVNNGSHQLLIFQPIQKILTTFPGLDNTIAQWGSKGLSNEKINSPYTTNHKLSPKIVWMNYSRIRLEFKGS